MNKEELYHSDIYLGEDFSDGIRHWKYIKRERKNGRWVYYYKDGSLDSLKKQKDYNLKALREENKKRGYGNDSNAYIIAKGKRINDIVYKKLSNDAAHSSNDYNFKKAKSDKRKKKYEKYLIRPLNSVSNQIYKGKQKINTLLNKFKKKK